MNNRTILNLIIVIAVVAVVGGVAWHKSNRSETLRSELEPTPSPALDANNPHFTETATPDEPVTLAPSSTSPNAAGPTSTRPAARAQAPLTRTPTTQMSATQTSTRQTRTTPEEDKQLPRVLDVGSDKCVACKKLAPIMAALKVECAGRAKIDFLDAWKQPEARTQYKIQMIPTLIFFDGDGKETARHIGFLSKEGILTKLREAGMKADVR